MPPTPSPFPGLKVLPLFCRGRPESRLLLVASDRFFSCSRIDYDLGHCKWEEPRPTKSFLWKARFVQPYFLDVVRYNRFHKTAKWFAGSRSFANRRGGNWLVDFIQQMDAGTA